MFNFQRRQIIENAEANTATLSNVIKANLRHAMITVDRGMEKDIIQTVVSKGTVDAARILNARGFVTTSSTPSEVGSWYNQKQPACQVCHANAAPTTEKTVIFTEKTGRQVLFNVNLLENETDCQGCHADDGQVLGLLMIETPLDAVQAQLKAGYLKTGFLALGTCAVLAGALVLALRRFVIGPVEKLENGVVEISAGNLEGHIEIEDGDELGRLAHSLNAMRRQLKSSRAEMQDRNQELSVLNQVALTVSQSLDLQEVLNRALETVTDNLGMEAGFIRLADGVTGSLKLSACKCAAEGYCREIELQCMDPDSEISAEVLRTSKTYYVPDMASDKRFSALCDHLEERSYILVPLKSKGSVAGTLGLLSYAGRPMSERTVVVIEAMANEIGVAVENALLLADSHRSEKEASTLYQLGMQISASLALSEVLHAVAEAARELLEADISLVGLLDEERQEVFLKAAAGIRVEAFTGIRLPAAGSPCANSFLSGQPVMADMDDPNQPILLDEALIKDENIQSFLAVPLERGGRVLGLIEVMTRQQRRFLPRDGHLLMRLAHHVVVAIENALLYRQLRYMVILEERDRLGREMHDNLSQTLGYLNIKTSLIDELLVDGQVAQARESMVELKRALKIAYTDVREAIFNLRTSISPGVGLLGTLHDYLTEYRAHYGLDARLILENDDLAELSPETAAQLLRIIQEALVNVRKHAEANKVCITFMRAGDLVSITIEDNGRGFAPDQVPGVDQQHFGMQIMRERAESVGGSLELVTQPGLGTRVIVRVPILSPQEEG